MKKFSVPVDYLSTSASATDYTGLIPTPPQSEHEEEAYQDLYPCLPAHTLEKDAE